MPAGGLAMLLPQVRVSVWWIRLCVWDEWGYMVYVCTSDWDALEWTDFLSRVYSLDRIRIHFGKYKAFMDGRRDGKLFP